MKNISFLKKSVYSALTFFGTLIILSAVYAAYQNILSSEYASGQPLTQSLFGKVVSNIADHETRINTLATSIVPTGAIMAFNLATCPTGWTEYTPARGRFLRGLDGGAGNDPDCASRTGGCAVGSTQGDAFQGHHHAITFSVDNTGLPNIYPYMSNGYSATPENSTTEGATSAVTDGTNGTHRTTSETRPKNVMVLFCSKN